MQVNVKFKAQASEQPLGSILNRQARWTQNSEITDFICLLAVKSQFTIFIGKISF